MKRWVKWTVGVIGALVVVAAAAVAVGTQLAERKSQRHVRIELQPASWAMSATAPDAPTLARGKYIVLQERGGVWSLVETNDEAIQLPTGK